MWTLDRVITSAHWVSIWQFTRKIGAPRRKHSPKGEKSICNRSKRGPNQKSLGVFIGPTQVALIPISVQILSICTSIGTMAESTNQSISPFTLLRLEGCAILPASSGNACVNLSAMDLNLHQSNTGTTLKTVRLEVAQIWVVTFGINFYKCCVHYIM